KERPCDLSRQDPVHRPHGGWRMILIGGTAPSPCGSSPSRRMRSTFCCHRSWPTGSPPACSACSPISFRSASCRPFGHPGQGFLVVPACLARRALLVDPVGVSKVAREFPTQTPTSVFPLPQIGRCRHLFLSPVRIKSPYSRHAEGLVFPCIPR